MTHPSEDPCRDCGWARALHTTDGTTGQWGTCRQFEPEETE